jgi:acyl-CoA thioesterase
MQHPPPQPKKLTLSETRAYVRRMPFNQTIGLHVARVHADGVTLELEMRDNLRNGFGGLHGGVSASIADAAVGIAVLRHFGGTRVATTVELKINYFKPIASGKVTARSRLLRIGNHLVVGSVDLTDSKRASAGFATVTYMLLEESGKPAAGLARIPSGRMKK